MKSYSLLGLALMMATPLVALSQDDVVKVKEPTQRGLVIEEIIVTAQKREQSINDVSIAISAFSGEVLEELGVTDTRDLSNLVPGFRYAESGYNTPVYSLRGVGFNEASQTASATVGVYVDEVNLPFPIMSKGANLDIERLEVLKGPQGTLYGRNTTGGAINYIANKPDEFFEAGIRGSYGRFETSDVEGYISGPLTEDLKARLALRNIHSGQGWQQRVTRDDELGKLDKQSGRLLIEWDVTDRATLSASLNAWRDNSEPQAPQAIGVRAQNAVLGDIYVNLGLDRNLALSPAVLSQPLVSRDNADPRDADWSDEIDFRLRDRFYGASLRAEVVLNDDSNMVWLMGYQDFRSDGSTIPQSGLGITAGERELFVDTTAYSMELRFDGVWGESGEWLGGIFYSHDDVDEVQDLFAGDISTAFPTPLGEAADLLESLLGVEIPLVGNVLIDRGVFAGAQQADSYAIFGNTFWLLSDAFKLNLGLRYTTEERDFRGCTRDSPNRSEGIGLATAFTALSLAQGGNGSVPESGCASLDEQTRNPGEYHNVLKEDNVSGRVALDWTPIEGQLFYASLSRGYKSGSFPILSASEQKQYEPVTQERLDALELGSKLTLWSGRLQLNGSVFYYDYRDKQLLGNIKDPIFGPIPILVNAPESSIQGLELELQANPVEGLFLSAAVNLMETEVEEFIGTDENGDVEDFAGNKFNFAPDIEYTLMANYAFPLSPGYMATAGVVYSYTGQTNASLGNEEEFEQDDYFLLNARFNIGPERGPWEMGVWGRNLTDELATISIQKAADPYSRYVSMTRTFGLSVSYDLQ